MVARAEGVSEDCGCCGEANAGAPARATGAKKTIRMNSDALRLSKYYPWAQCLFDERRKAYVVRIGNRSGTDTYNKGFAEESW
jgi:hypothetical protein